MLRSAAVALAVLALALVACSEPKTGDKAASTDPDDAVVAGRIAGRTVTVGELDAWIKEDATKIGYEVSFTRHFYKPQPLRMLEEISADILAIEKEAEGLLDGLLAVPGDRR